MSEPASETNPVLNPVPTLCSPCARSVRELVLAAVESRIVLAVEGESLRAAGPRSATELGKELIGRKAEVVAWLKGWNLEAMRALQLETDGLVERLVVSGADEVIQAEATRCVLAHHAEDALGVVNACQAIQARARDLANRKG